ncbi:MAG: hypothetical protein JSS14_25650 [Proteobacteria bacterium]|nr:hypothetical protein [Pseudomonadota bacterium]
MNHSKQQLIWAVASTLSLLLAGMVWAQGTPSNSGVIHFAGEIVASPFAVFRSEKPSANAMRHHRGATGELVFERESVHRPSASVHVHSLKGVALDLGFVDSRGARRAMQQGLFHRIGHDGGTLSMVAQATGGPHASLVTVVYD